MSFIDYLPWPVYILILLLSLIITLKYIITDKKLNRGERIGYFLVAFGGANLIIIKIVEETSFYLVNYRLLEFFIAVMIPGFIIAGIGGYNRVDDPERKRTLLLGLILFSISAIFFGFLFLYFWLV